ncbi:MAG: hypothetical protein IPI67_03995 [Myxococcales bacterium]|nr:hypothetical protein [Myxococcales bacterium]
MSKSPGGGGAGAPAGVSAADDCGYTDACTEGSVTGHGFYCPHYAKVPPATGCVLGTKGTLANLHWCCPDPICSHFKSTDYVCANKAGQPHDYSCAPGAPAAAGCADDGAAGFCCAF